MKILTIDGGGLRGIIPVQALKYIEEVSGKKIYELFDLIVGTSTGGILAYALSLGYSAKELEEFYYIEGPKIFKNRPLGFLSSKYLIKNLENSLIKYFGNKVLSDCKVKTIVTSRDKLNKENLIFKSWSEHWKDLLIYQAAASTAAAPSYFETYDFSYKGRRHLAWDGGLYAADPSFIAQNEANFLGSLDSQIIMLNLGTGKANHSGFSSINPNKLKLVGEITSDMLDSQSELAKYSMKLSLKENYYSWDIPIDLAKSAMDNPNLLNYWKNTSQKHLNNLNNVIQTLT